MAHYDPTRYPDKHRLRTLPYEIVKARCFCLADNEGRLLYDWVELAGTQAPTCAYLASEGALDGHGRFVGVDRDDEGTVIPECRDMYAGHNAEFIQGDFDDTIRRWDRPIGVLVYDSYDGLNATPYHLLTRANTLRLVAEANANKIGQCVLVLNLTAGQWRNGSAQNPAKWLAVLTRVFKRNFKLVDISEGCDGTFVPVYNYRSTHDPMLWTCIVIERSSD